jgi:hypothetical protein
MLRATIKPFMLNVVMLSVVASPVVFHINCDLNSPSGLFFKIIFGENISDTVLSWSLVYEGTAHVLVL